MARRSHASHPTVRPVQTVEEQAESLCRRFPSVEPSVVDARLNILFANGNGCGFDDAGRRIVPPWSDDHPELGATWTEAFRRHEEEHADETATKASFGSMAASIAASIRADIGPQIARMAAMDGAPSTLPHVYPEGLFRDLGSTPIHPDTKRSYEQGFADLARYRFGRLTSPHQPAPGNRINIVLRALDDRRTMKELFAVQDLLAVRDGIARTDPPAWLHDDAAFVAAVRAAAPPPPDVVDGRPAPPCDGAAITAVPTAWKQVGKKDPYWWVDDETMPHQWQPAGEALNIGKRRDIEGLYRWALRIFPGERRMAPDVAKRIADADKARNAVAKRLIDQIIAERDET